MWPHAKEAMVVQATAAMETSYFGAATWLSLEKNLTQMTTSLTPAPFSLPQASHPLPTFCPGGRTPHFLSVGPVAGIPTVSCRGQSWWVGATSPGHTEGCGPLWDMARQGKDIVSSHLKRPGLDLPSSLCPPPGGSCRSSPTRRQTG